MEKILAEELLAFIHQSPSVYHVVDNFKQQLIAAQYQPLLETELWNVQPGGRYFVIRNDSSIIAFQVPTDITNYNFNIVASHSDCPTFKLKPNCIINTDENYTSLNVEPYGGILMATWFDRPLTIAGRVLVKTTDGVKSTLFHYDDNLLMIPSLAIHMNREANTGVALNPQRHLLPLMSKVSDDYIDQLIATTLKIDVSNILEKELFLAPTHSGYLWGPKQEYLASSHLDDLQCAFTSFKAFLANEYCQAVNVFCCFDNEEIGSRTRQGAASTFLRDTLEKISKDLQRDGHGLSQALAQSLLISADNGHAAHPNYPEKNDPTNKVYMNQGIVIKYNANQSYVTDGLSAALFRNICQLANVKVQSYTNRSDIRGGGTLGSISLAQVSVLTVDIGLAQLAMHSINETAGVKDTYDMYQALKTFYSKAIRFNEKGYKLQ